jgi:hypothetical protein
MDNWRQFVCPIPACPTYATDWSSLFSLENGDCLRPSFFREDTLLPGLRLPRRQGERQRELRSTVIRIALTVVAARIIVSA